MADDEGVEVELIAQARALHSYVPTPSEEDQTLTFLAFQKGDLIDVIEMHESGWWEGSCRDNIGLFPGSYVEVVEMYTTGAAAGDEEEEGSPSAKAASVTAATTTSSAATLDAPAASTSSRASSSTSAAASDPLLEARRFALQLKAMYDAKVAELADAAQVTERTRLEAVESSRVAEQARAELAVVTAAKEALEAAGGGGEGGDAGAVAALEAEVKAAKQQRQEAQAEAERLDQELRAALDAANEANAKVAALESAAATGASSVDPAALEALQAEVTQAKQQRMALQTKVDSMDVELREALDRANEAEAKAKALESAGGAAAAAAPAVDPAALETLQAELKLAKQQRMALQTKVDGMDMELREALDRANEAEAKAKALESGGAAAVPQELGDSDVLKAELRMAKQQRQTLQTKVEEMDMELREALDKANEGASAVKALAEAQATIKKLQDGGASAGGGASSEELTTERNKRERAERDLATLKEEHEALKKAGGSASILQIKLQAMEKELTKTRKQLETAGSGPQKELDEANAQLKEFKDKSRKLESELDVALNRAAANEEAMQQRTELRKQLDELREQMASGKEPVDKETNPKYKLEKMAKENAELREKLAALGGSNAPAASASNPALASPAASTPVGSPAVKRLKVPGAVKAGGGGGGGDATPKKPDGGSAADVKALEEKLHALQGERDVELRALKDELAARETRIAELEAESRKAPAPAAVGGLKPGAPLGRASGAVADAKEREMREQLAAKDARIAELERKLTVSPRPVAAPPKPPAGGDSAAKDARIAELEAEVKALGAARAPAAAAAAPASAAATAPGTLAARPGMDGALQLELKEAKMSLSKREAQIADLEQRLKATVSNASSGETQLKADLRRAQDDVTNMKQRQQREAMAAKKEIDDLRAKVVALGGVVAPPAAAATTPADPTPAPAPSAVKAPTADGDVAAKAPKKVVKLIKNVAPAGEPGAAPKADAPKGPGAVMPKAAPPKKAPQ